MQEQRENEPPPAFTLMVHWVVFLFLLLALGSFLIHFRAYIRQVFSAPFHRFRSNGLCSLHSLTHCSLSLPLFTLLISERGVRFTHPLFTLLMSEREAVRRGERTNRTQDNRLLKGLKIP